MGKYVRLHEAFVSRSLGEEHDGTFWEQLADFHARQIAFVQHERLVHLLVMLTVALLLLLSFGYVAHAPSLPAFAIAGLFVVLEAAYLLHYYQLENAVQRWYHLSNRLDDKRGRVHAHYS
jgi:hypothetical protein